MQDNRSLRGLSLRSTGGLILVLSAIILMTGGGAAWWAWKQLDSNPGNSKTTQINGTDSSTSPTDVGGSDDLVTIAPTITTSVMVYFLDATETGMELVPFKVDTEVNAEAAEDSVTILTSALEQLIKGNANSESSLAFSELPQETELLALTVESDGVHVDLSRTFIEGGGSASMIGRLTQVVYTATSLDAMQPVWLSVEGEPLELLGGEGLEIPQPMTREMVDEEFPLF